MLSVLNNSNCASLTLNLTKINSVFRLKKPLDYNAKCVVLCINHSFGHKVLYPPPYPRGIYRVFESHSRWVVRNSELFTQHILLLKIFSVHLKIDDFKNFAAAHLPFLSNSFILFPFFPLQLLHNVNEWSIAYSTRHKLDSNYWPPTNFLYIGWYAFYCL